MILWNIALSCVVLFLSYRFTRSLTSPTSRLRLLDRPNERSLHTEPTPRTGGLAVLGSLWVGFVFAWVADEIRGDRLSHFGVLSIGPETYWILGMTFILGAVSFWDDRIGLPTAVRFGIHGVAAAGVVWGAGLTIDLVPLPFLGYFSLGWTVIPFTLLFMMWMTNLYNFMDGIDGFAGGMAVLGFGFLSYLGWSGGQQPIFLISLLVASASAGFLLWNFPPAKIFMGDVGSTSIGFLAGALSLLGAHDGLFDIWVPVLIFSPFIVDATVTLLRRLVQGKKVWQAHRKHYYQRLVLAGWGHRKTVLAEYTLMVICGVGAILYQILQPEARLLLLIGFALLYVFLIAGVRGIERKGRSFHGAVSQKMDSR